MNRLFKWENGELAQLIVHFGEEAFIFNYMDGKFNDFEILDEEDLDIDDWPEAKQVKGFGKENHRIVRFILDGQHLDY